MTKWEDMGAKTMYSLDDVNGSMKNVDGTMKGMTESQEQSFGTQFQETLRTLGTILEPIGIMILDLVNQAMPHLKKFADWFVGLNPIVHQAMAVFGVIGTILAPVISVFGMVAGAIGKIIPVVTQVWNWLSKLKPLWTAIRVVMLALSGPVGLVIGVIMLLVGVFKLLWDNNEGFRNAVKKIWDEIVKFFTVTIGKIWNDLVKWATDLVTSIPKKFEEIKKGISDKWNAAMKFLTDTNQKIRDKISEWGENLRKYIVDKFQSIKQGVQDKFNSMKDAVVNTALNIYNGIKDRFNNMKDTVVNTALNIYNGVKDKFNSMKTTLQNTVENIKTSVRDKFNSAKDFIINPIETARDKIKGIIDKIKGFFTNLKLKIPKIELPRMPIFSLSTGSKTVFGKTITYPNGLDISWHKTGGVFVDPVVAGNAGFGDVEEAIVPFKGKHAGKIANLIAREQAKLSDAVMGRAESVIQQVINLTVVSELDGEVIGRGTASTVDQIMGDKANLKAYMRGDRR